MSITYDDLFAYRVSFLDTIDDENIIIRELKKKLFRSGMTNIDEINDFLVNFYKNYDIEISKEVISQVEFNNNINQNNFSNMNFFQLIENFNNLNNLSNLNSSNENNTNNDIDDLDDVDDFTDDDIPELEDIEEIEEEEDNPNNLSNVQLPNITVNLNNGNIIFPPVVSGHTFSYGINPLVSGSSFSYGVNPPVNSPNNNVNSTQFIQGFNAFMQAVNNVNNVTNNNLEPVRITLSKDDENIIKNFVAEKDLDFNCTVCMSGLKKGEELSELPCKHIFHKECVMEWLNKYSYLCPTCRKECGNGKKNI